MKTYCITKLKNGLESEEFICVYLESELSVEDFKNICSNLQNYQDVSFEEYEKIIKQQFDSYTNKENDYQVINHTKTKLPMKADMWFDSREFEDTTFRTQIYNIIQNANINGCTFIRDINTDSVSINIKGGYLYNPDFKTIYPKEYTQENFDKLANLIINNFDNLSYSEIEDFISLQAEIKQNEPTMEEQIEL